MFFSSLWAKTVSPAEQTWLESPAGSDESPLKPYYIAKAMFIRAGGPILAWLLIFATCLAVAGFAVISLIVRLAE